MRVLFLSEPNCPALHYVPWDDPITVLDAWATRIDWERDSIGERKEESEKAGFSGDGPDGFRRFRASVAMVDGDQDGRQCCDRLPAACSGG